MKNNLLFDCSATFIAVLCCLLFTTPTQAQTPIQHLTSKNSTSIELNAEGGVSKWLDISGNEQHATSKIGSVTFPSTITSFSGQEGLDFGADRNSLKLLSSTDAAQVFDFTGDAASNSGFAVLLTFQMESLHNNWSDIIGNNSNTDNGGFGIRYADDGEYQVYLGSLNAKIPGAKAIPGQSIVVAVNYDATKGELTFWDSQNKLKQTYDVTAANFNIGDLFLGSNSNGNRYFKGIVGDVKIYNEALSNSKFKTEYSQLYDLWQGFTLPVEVLGGEGLVETRTFELGETKASNTQKVWLQINNLSYENKASVKINNGSWIDINHSSVEMYEQEKARGGMQHGGYNTIRFTYPTKDIQTGTNTVSFRFNHSDGISNGFRVVKFNLLNENDEPLLPDNFFYNDDPNLWVSPYTDNTSIAEGEDLWRNAGLWSNYLEEGTEGFWYGYSLKAHIPMNAKCADCHTQDGRDLEIFSYSNKSIIERAKFHDLNDEQARKIASYIRSLSGKHENVNRHGRPWNPPYQPGPELEGKSIDYWAAGAGLDAVLEKDEEMLPYMFPNGVNEETVKDYFDQDQGEDRTTLPLAIQFPDWKHWLPMIHPKDAFTEGNLYETSYQDRTPYVNNQVSLLNPEKGYEVLREYILTLPTNGDGVTVNMNALSENQLAEFRLQHEIFRYNYRFFQAQGGGDTRHWRSTTGNGLDALSPDVPQEFAATSMARLMAVKNFEFMLEFNLQDQAPNYIDAVDQPSGRQWFHGLSKHVFEVPAHITGCLDGDCQTFDGQPLTTGQYESSVWYHLQGILAGGEGYQWWNGPVDYNYHPQFILASSYSSNIFHPLRYYHSIGTMYKTKTWSGDDNPNDGMGFRIRVQGPWYFFGKEGDGGKNNFLGFEPGVWPQLLDDIEPGMSKWVLDALLQEFLKAVRKHDISEWERWTPGENGSNMLDPIEKSSVVDVTLSNDEISATSSGDEDTLGEPLWADHMYWVIQESIKFGVKCETIEELIAWSKEAWPNINWDFNISPSVKLRLSPNAQLYRNVEFIEAIPASGGGHPSYSWTVNGVVVNNNSNKLYTTDFEPGDIVGCTMTSSSDCVDSNIASTTIDVPGDIIINTKINTEDWQKATALQACFGDEITFRADVDIQPILWLDAQSVSTTATYNDGDQVMVWEDISGNNANAEVSNSTLAPYYSVDGFNGKPALEFGRTRGSLLTLFEGTETEFLEEDWTIFMVHQLNPIDVWSNTLGNKNTTTDDGMFFRISDNGKMAISGGKKDISGDAYDLPLLAINTISKGDDVMSLFVNGTQETTLTITEGDKLDNGEDLLLGQISYSTSQSRYHQGYIAEVIILDRKLNTAETQLVEGYLAHKWGLTSDLTVYNKFRDHSPLEMLVEAPSGDDYQFTKLSNTFSYTVSDQHDLGEFNFIPAQSEQNNFTLPLSSYEDYYNQAVVLYSIDGGASQQGNIVNLYDGESVTLLPFEEIDVDYEWVTPEGISLTQNTNPTWTAALEDTYNGVWKLRILEDRCLSTFPEIEVNVTVDELNNSGPYFGRVDITQANASDWTSVNFGYPMASSPIVITGPVSNFGSAPAIPRVKNITTDGFEIQVDEWDYLDGVHNKTEELYYLALEEGTYDFGGVIAEAGSLTGKMTWVNKSFINEYTEAPVVLAVQVSDNEANATTLQIKDVTTTGFTIRMREEENADQVHADEVIHYIVLSKGTGTINGETIEVGATENIVDDEWYQMDFTSDLQNVGVLANMQTRNGSNTSGLRYRNLTYNRVDFMVEEEQSKDEEVDHPFEEVGYLRMENMNAGMNSNARQVSNNLEEDLNGVTLRVYPNPTSCNLFIEAKRDIRRIEIFDNLGRKVYCKKAGHSSETINLHTLATDMYLLRIHLDNGEILNEKVLKK
ncbi:LamG-like jellyroll fold domain-containing protein [Flammeovirga agarivorans]|uniref:T9SS type A sorting domain-containing protein n=1 Tax=Flammeovirga agarivorans TaxID=2726742 RepID=A0A7X8SQ62_9BACT|nr:LamG-like jellyroll fold domain-containing protein [Flammeovirga agarivorans]NLR94379.1 T9SS type A sorting domain-containing protein [Flammeovirga agarivorans]